MRGAWLALLFLCRPAPASFLPGQVRYLTPFDLMETLRASFPVNESKRVPAFCRELDATNRAVTGDSQPETGQPAMSEPTGGFMRWYASCLNIYVDNASREARQAREKKGRGENFTTLFGPELAKWAGRGNQRLDSPWRDLDEATRRKFFHFEVQRLIGPAAVITDLGHVAGEDELYNLMDFSLDRGDSVFVAMKKAMYFLGLRDEFLTY